MSIGTEGKCLNLPVRETHRHPVSILPNPVERRYNRCPLEARDQDRSLRQRVNIHHNKNYIHHKNPNTQGNPTAGVPALEESSQVRWCGVLVGAVLVNKQKLYDPRASVAFLGFESTRLGVEPSE